jgi:uncharacterized membrane protein SirB2
MATTLLNIHKAVVILFLLIYLIKTILLLASKYEQLGNFTKIMKVPEMAVSFLFLVTGIWLLVITGSVSTLQIIKIVAVLASIPLAVVGFKKRNKALALISLLLIIGAYGLAEVNGKRKNKPKEVAASNINGEDLYKSANCMSCHGAEGKAGLGGATDLSTSTLSAAEAVEVIKNGRNGMPANPQLTAEQLTALSEYIQTLKK